MSSYYTAPVENGTITTLAQFARRCAPGLFYDCSTLPEKFEAGSYLAKLIAEREVELAELQTMTIEQAEKRARESHDRIVADLRKALERARELRIRYEKLLAAVTTWQPPNNEYCIRLKNLMHDQLEQAIRHDCDAAYYERRIAAEVCTPGAEYIALGLRGVSEDLVRNRKEYQAELDSVAARNEFLKLLAEIK